MKQKLLAALTLFIIFLLSNPLWVEASPTGFYLTSSIPTVNQGSIFTLTVKLNESSPVNAVGVSLNYPSDLLSLDGQPVIISGSPFDTISNIQSGTVGTISFDEYAVGIAPQGATGDNALVNLTFTAKNAGNAGFIFNSYTEADYGTQVTKQSTPLNEDIASLSSPVIPTYPVSPIANSSGNPVVNTLITKSIRPPITPSKNTDVALENNVPLSTSNVVSNQDGGLQAPPSTAMNHQRIIITLDNIKGQPLINARLVLGDNNILSTNNAGQATISGLAPGVYPATITYQGKSYDTQINVSNLPNNSLQHLKISVPLKNTRSLQSLTEAVFGMVAVILLVFLYWYLRSFIFHSPYTLAIPRFNGGSTNKQLNKYAPSISIRSPAVQPIKLNPGDIIHPTLGSETGEETVKGSKIS